MLCFCLHVWSFLSAHHTRLVLMIVRWIISTDVLCHLRSAYHAFTLFVFVVGCCFGWLLLLLFFFNGFWGFHYLNDSALITKEARGEEREGITNKAKPSINRGRCLFVSGWVLAGRKANGWFACRYDYFWTSLRVRCTTICFVFMIGIHTPTL